MPALSPSSSNSSGGETRAAVLRDSCSSFSVAVGERLANCYQKCESLTVGLHSEVACAAVDLTAAVMVALGDLGDSDQGQTAISEFNKAVQLAVFNSFAANICLYDPDVEYSSLFGDSDNSSWLKIRKDVLERLGTNSFHVEEEKQLDKLKEELKVITASYQKRVDDLVSIAKYGHITKNDDEVSSKESFDDDMDLFKRRLREILEEKHKKVEQDTPKRKESFMWLSDSKPSQEPVSVRTVQTAIDESSTASDSPRRSGLFCCFGGSKCRPKGKAEETIRKGTKEMNDDKDSDT